jgi:hypothetical protein
MYSQYFGSNTCILTHAIRRPDLVSPGDSKKLRRYHLTRMSFSGRTATTALRLVRIFSLALRILRALAMLWKVSIIWQLLAKKIRQRFSQGMRRYQKMGFDLDLTYIASRLVCMAAPAVNQLYTRTLNGDIVALNDVTMVARYFLTHHYDNFRTFNFCAEALGNYATKNVFGQVRRIPTPESTAPRLSDLLLFCENAAHYLLLDDSKTLLLHCNTGCERSGVFASAFLLYSGHCFTASESMDYFIRRRTTNRDQSGEPQVIHGASLARVVRYLEAILRDKERMTPVELMLSSIHVTSVPLENLRVMVICDGKVLLDTEDQESNIVIRQSEVSFPTLMIHGDVQISVYDKRSDAKLPDFFVQFHTAFASNRSIVKFDKDQIDFVAQSQASYPRDMHIIMNFTDDKMPRLKMLDAFR